MSNSVQIRTVSTEKLWAEELIVRHSNIHHGSPSYSKYKLFMGITKFQVLEKSITFRRIKSATPILRLEGFDMYTADSIVALVRGSKTVFITVAEWPQCCFVGGAEKRGAFLYLSLWLFHYR